LNVLGICRHTIKGRVTHVHSLHFVSRRATATTAATPVTLVIAGATSAARCARASVFSPSVVRIWFSLRVTDIATGTSTTRTDSLTLICRETAHTFTCLIAGIWWWLCHKLCSVGWLIAITWRTIGAWAFPYRVAGPTTGDALANDPTGSIRTCCFSANTILWTDACITSVVCLKLWARLTQITAGTFRTTCLGSKTTFRTLTLIATIIGRKHCIWNTVSTTATTGTSNAARTAGATARTALANTGIILNTPNKTHHHADAQNPTA
jgi:hypothetical protein